MSAGAGNSVWKLSWPEWEGLGRKGLEKEGEQKGGWMYVNAGVRENLPACRYILNEAMFSGVHKDWYGKHFSLIKVYFFKKRLAESLEVTVLKT